MKDFIIDNLNELQAADIMTVVLNNVVALIIALFIMFTYKVTYSGAAYSKKFNVSIGMMTLVTTMIMCVISNDIALSLGMVGALSIIRFRTAVKDVRDATYIFWCIAVGVGCGVSQYILVAISSVVIFAFLLLLRQVVSENKMLLIIKGSLETQNKIEAEVVQYFDGKAHQIMKNASENGCEFVYSVTSGILKKKKDQKKIDIVEKIMKVEGVKNVNIVEQTDDISR